MSNPAVELAAMAASLNRSIASSVIVNVAAVAAELVTTMLVTTVVVDAGTVYRVVLDVAAAPLKSALVNVAISYYFLLVG
jgi:hypothetical protein